MLLPEEPSSHSQSTKVLIEKMVTNQGWSEEKLQTQKDAMHTLEETDMLAVNYIS
jgi:hypothetical protein